MLFCLSLFPQMFPSFITLLTHLCPRSGSASSSSPGPQVPGAVCPDCQADTACCEDAAGVMPASDTGYVDSWSEQVYTDSTIKWQHTFGSLPTHRHEKPVLLTFLWRLIDCSLTQHTVTVSSLVLRWLRRIPEKSQRRPPCGTMNYSSASPGWGWGRMESLLPSSPLQDPETAPPCIWGVKTAKGWLLWLTAGEKEHCGGTWIFEFWVGLKQE